MSKIINPQKIRIEDYTYNLPNSRIAKHPLNNRDESKLLVYNKGSISDLRFNELPNILKQGDLLVYNDTKVIHARIIFRKETGAKIEIFCLEPETPADYILAFESRGKCQWKCMIGNLKKWKSGSLHRLLTFDNEEVTLSAIKKSSNSNIIEFSWNNDNYSFAEILEKSGIIPIPPYLNRDTEESDKDQYQTVYSNIKGSVAAPTAGLHFTDNTLNKLSDNNIDTAKLTLHVGAGTFKPVSTDKIGDHDMHSEHFIVPKESLVKLLTTKGRIIAVGTTSSRTLESLYWFGVQMLSDKFHDNHLNQWDAYNLPQNIRFEDSINEIIKHLENKNLDYFKASTQIIIAPGYTFKIINALITNFHMPRSTLLLLIAAFIGDDWKKVYDYALNNKFRFLSYGDSSILLPKL